MLVGSLSSSECETEGATSNMHSRGINPDQTYNSSNVTRIERPGHELVSHQTVLLVQIVIVIAVCGSVSLLGVVANILNIVVFAKQGFKDSINISLCGLAVADLGSVTFMFWMSACYSLALFKNLDSPFDPQSVMYLTGGCPHVCCARISSVITAFITLERCLCITTPLKIKSLITPARTKVIIVSIFIVICILFSPFYAVNTLQPCHIQSKNRTILALVYTENRILVETVTFAIHSVGLATISLMTVIVCTAILIVKINEKTKWRQTSVAQIKSKTEVATIKDKKVVKMVTLISIIFITCYTPATVNFFLMAYEPKFSHGGEYGNVYFVVWSVTCFVQIVNFSVNIIVYFKMSSKFKVTLIQLFSSSK